MIRLVIREDKKMIEFKKDQKLPIIAPWLESDGEESQVWFGCDCKLLDFSSNSEKLKKYKHKLIPEKNLEGSEALIRGYAHQGKVPEWVELILMSETPLDV